MDANDMGLPDDELLKSLHELAKRGFDFEDLLAVEQNRQERIDEIAGVIAQHGKKGGSLPRALVEAADIPILVDTLIHAGFHHPGASASLAIRLTNALRGFQSETAKRKLEELLTAMTDAEDGDLTIKLVMDTCKRELG